MRSRAFRTCRGRVHRESAASCRSTDGNSRTRPRTTSGPAHAQIDVAVPRLQVDFDRVREAPEVNCPIHGTRCLSLHLHDGGCGQHIRVEIGHDPQRPADDQGDDQNAEGEPDGVGGKAAGGLVPFNAGCVAGRPRRISCVFVHQCAPMRYTKVSNATQMMSSACQNRLKQSSRRRTKSREPRTAVCATRKTSHMRPAVTCAPCRPTRLKKDERKALREGPAPCATMPANSLNSNPRNVAPSTNVTAK